MPLMGVLPMRLPRISGPELVSDDDLDVGGAGAAARIGDPVSRSAR